MSTKAKQLEFPLAYSQEDLRIFRELLAGHPRQGVLSAALALRGVQKISIAHALKVHPTFVNQLFAADALSPAHHASLTGLGLPGFLLPPERTSGAAA